MIKDKTLRNKLITFFGNIGLLIISIAILVAVGFEVWSMMTARLVALTDLLLLFIYLEVLAMVAIYLNSAKLPVRMPLYITGVR